MMYLSYGAPRRPGPIADVISIASGLRILGCRIVGRRIVGRRIVGRRIVVAASWVAASWAAPEGRPRRPPTAGIRRSALSGYNAYSA
ncbi:hypothetical protein Pme01_34150 [Planosporangium mesophilum]|uniref:Uncharacterized protein n=1 Tax=Planosporangium mesophilum TaxID=689768 RepID=A0A8J3TC94_9ACTN|nr:hypothetical protein Pme01_34150 [Planosporangium mesophilum]